MASEEQPDPLEQLFLIAHPNPERIGCPGTDVLKALARRRLPGDDPAEKHLGECSPCFKEYLAFRKACDRAQRRRRRLLFGASLAACLAFGVVLVANGRWLSDRG